MNDISILACFDATQVKDYISNYSGDLTEILPAPPVGGQSEGMVVIDFVTHRIIDAQNYFPVLRWSHNYIDLPGETMSNARKFFDAGLGCSTDTLDFHTPIKNSPFTLPKIESYAHALDIALQVERRDTIYAEPGNWPYPRPLKKTELQKLLTEDLYEPVDPARFIGNIYRYVEFFVRPEIINVERWNNNWNLGNTGRLHELMLDLGFKDTPELRAAYAAAKARDDARKVALEAAIAAMDLPVDGRIGRKVGLVHVM